MHSVKKSSLKGSGPYIGSRSTCSTHRTVYQHKHGTNISLVDINLVCAMGGTQQGKKYYKKETQKSAT